MDQHPALLRELVHELRDALSPIRSALDLLRLRNFDAEVGRQAAQRIDRALDRALAALDAAVLGAAVAPAPAGPQDTRAGETGSLSKSGSTTRILIVDDNAEVRRAYCEVLVALGYSVTEAADAEEALRVTAEEPPDVALIDIHLPRMNGYRLAQALRVRAHSAIRLVMLSGVTLDETTQRLSRSAGFDDCLDKAAGPRALHALLRASPSTL
jgi:CheY-like chemotaxis protein